MVEKQTPSWGNKIVGSGQVHCVRQLGLTEEDWQSVASEGARRWGEERHITSVKMSPEHADEVIVSFSRHSTSIFSTLDSPYSASASAKASSSSPTIIKPNTKSRAIKREEAAEESNFGRSPRLGVPKRKQSQLSTSEQELSASWSRSQQLVADMDAQTTSAAGPSRSRRRRVRVEVEDDRRELNQEQDEEEEAGESNQRFLDCG